MDYDRKFQDTLIKQGEPAEELVAAVARVSGVFGAVEVKTDLQAWDTGNIFVELNSRNSESGLTTTKADWFVYVIVEVKDKDYDSYVFNPENVRSMLFMRTEELRKVAQPHLFRVIRGGDSDTSQGMLIPLTRLPLHANPMFEPVRNCPCCTGACQE